MISYRHHIASLVAVFLALAVGVVLGGGPLSDLGRDDRAASATTQRTTTRSAAYGDVFASSAAPTLYAGRLKEHGVAIVAMPGADAHTIDALSHQVTAAGGRVTGTYAARAALTQPSQKSLVDTLGSQLVAQLGSGPVDAAAPTYVRMGQLLALAVASPKAATGDVAAVRESLAGADLVRTSKGATAGDLVLVVLGDTVDPAILSGLTTGLASKTTGVVATGTLASGTRGGDLVALRADRAAAEVATVDGSETPLGQVTSVLALIRSLTTQGGAFGASGSDGAVPLT